MPLLLLLLTAIPAVEHDSPGTAAAASNSGEVQGFSSTQRGLGSQGCSREGVECRFGEQGLKTSEVE